MRKEEQMNRRTLKSTLRSITVLVVGLLLAGSAFGVSPRTTHALDGGGSLALMAKEIADAVGWIFGDQIIAAISNQTYGWSMEGFGAMTLSINPESLDTIREFREGDTTFLQNPNAFFQSLGDDITVYFLSELESIAEESIEGVREGLAVIARDSNDSMSSRLTTTIDRNTLASFTSGDFAGSGGWETWLELTSNPQNYFDGALQIALSELSAAKNAAIERNKQELQQSGGFLSLRQCSQDITTITDASLRKVAAAQADEYGCLSYTNVTPGALIGDKVKSAISADLDRIGAADEITEIIAALVTTAIDQLVQQGFSEIRNVTQNFGTPSAVEQRGVQSVSQYERLLYSVFNDGTGAPEPPPPNPLDRLTWNSSPVLASRDVARGPNWAQLTWTPPGDRDSSEILGYMISRFEDAPSPDGAAPDGALSSHEKATVVATQSREDGTLRETSPGVYDLTFVDNSIVPNKRYGYFVTAFDTRYNRSQPSSTVIVDAVSEDSRVEPEVDIVPILRLRAGESTRGHVAPGVDIEIATYLIDFGSYWSPTEIDGSTVEVPRHDLVMTIKNAKSEITEQRVVTYGRNSGRENGSSETIEIPISGFSGDDNYIDVEVQADVSNKIKELSETNNSRTLRIYRDPSKNPTLITD